MKVDNFLKKWYGVKIKNYGTEISPEYKKFQLDYKSVIKELCKNINMEIYLFKKKDYCFSAYIKSNITNQYYYISIADVRRWKYDWANSVLYRVLENEKYCLSGRDQYCKLINLEENLLKKDLQIAKRLEKENNKKTTNQVKNENDKADELNVDYV